MLGMPAELDVATGDGLVEQGYAAIDHSAHLLLLDLTGLSFCDARGLSAFVQIANHADAAECVSVAQRNIEACELWGRVHVHCPPLQTLLGWLRRYVLAPAGRHGRVHTQAGPEAEPDLPRVGDALGKPEILASRVLGDRSTEDGTRNRTELSLSRSQARPKQTLSSRSLLRVGASGRPCGLGVNGSPVPPNQGRCSSKMQQPHHTAPANMTDMSL